MVGLYRGGGRGRGGGISNPALMIDAWCTIIHAARPKKEGRVVPLSGLRITQGYLNGLSDLFWTQKQLLTRHKI